MSARRVTARKEKRAAELRALETAEVRARLTADITAGRGAQAADMAAAGYGAVAGGAERGATAGGRRVPPWARFARSAQAPVADVGSGAFGGRLASAMLILAVILVPLVQPIGPGQIAVGDLLNVLGMALFGIVLLTRRPRITLPLIMPVFVIAFASLIATLNAAAPGQSLVTMAQDTYLYLWFVVLVNVFADHGDLRRVRWTWMVVSAAISLYGVYALMHTYHYGLGALFGAKGERAAGTFGNANFFADYLVISFFVIASLGSETSWMIRFPALGAILLGLMASKSLGGLLSLIGGLLVWFFARSATRRTSVLATVAVVSVLGGVALLGGWVVKEWGIGQKGLKVMTSQSVVGRLDKSSASRIQIWTELRNRFERRPLGIGPGNSSEIMLSVSNRERRGGSVQGKEAHNDYVGYAVERGPLALLALFAMIVISLQVLQQGWSRVRDRSSAVPGAWVAALAAGLIASSIHSFTIEKLHFRHFWFFLALLFALSARLKTRPPPAAEPVRPR